MSAPKVQERQECNTMTMETSSDQNAHPLADLEHTNEPNTSNHAQTCALCQRQGLPLTRHHLIPRTRHKTKWNRRNYHRDDVKTRILMLCSPCHRHVHAVLDEKSLERHYNTLEKLRQHPEIARFCQWLGEKPPSFRPKWSRRTTHSR